MMRYPTMAAACAIVLAACAAPLATTVPPPVAPAPVVDSVVELRTRHAVQPLVPSRAFRAAVARGTRTDAGTAGAAYWQNRVDYRIDAELDPASARVQGELTVRYRNNSPDTLRSVLLHLHQNAFAPGAQRVRRVPVTGGVDVQRVEVDGVPAARAGAAAAARPAGAAARPTHRIDGTLMWVDLAAPLVPGTDVTLDVAWRFTVPPRGAPRTGHADREAFVVAQWYPQVAVYDDVRGWHDMPYWTNGEFYLEYGNFDVSLTVPEGWLVTATGELDNAAEVLTPGALAALRRARSQDSVVHVVTADDHEQKTATLQEQGGALTWRYRARDVRDFAFATSNRYLWDAVRVQLPDANGDGAGDVILAHALYRPEARAWREAARYIRHAVTFHAREWGSYVYPHISAAEGPIGGMEYPMLVFIGAPSDPVALYSVLSHEIAHQWWPMMAGSNETRYAWQDEGLVTYVEDLSVRDYFTAQGQAPALATQAAYLRIAGTDAELPLMTAPDLFGIGSQYGVAAYTKPGTLLRALGAVIGDSTVHVALREYTARWLFRHPMPWDFFNTVESVAAQDLDWFWSPWFTTTATLDHAVDEVRSDSGGVTIVVRDVGDAPMPVLITITLVDGSTRELRMPVQPWLEGRTTQAMTVTLPAAPVRVELDVERRMPDVDRSNNTWTAPAGS